MTYQNVLYKEPKQTNRTTYEITYCRPIRSVIILVIKQIGHLRLLITRMITDRIGLHSVLLPLLIRSNQLK